VFLKSSVIKTWRRLVFAPALATQVNTSIHEYKIDCIKNEKFKRKKKQTKFKKKVKEENKKCCARAAFVIQIDGATRGLEEGR
jgi:hypothetical protein